MERLPAGAGWNWIKRGFALFRQQPAEMSTLFIMYVFVIWLVTQIPFIGRILQFLLVPAFAMAFMQACADIDRGKRVHPKVLLVGFRAAVLKPLLILGVGYLLAAILALVGTGIFDDGVFWRALNAPSSAAALEVNSPNDTTMVKSTLFWVCIYVPISMPLWFASPLIAWKNMSVGKAIFFSFFAVIRAIKAIIFYALAWTMIGVFGSVTIVALLQLLQIDNLDTGILLLFPFLILLTTVLYCSFYPRYTQIFGVPQFPEDT